MTEPKKLYKRTSTGAIQEWWQEIDGANYRSVSGQVDGKKVASAWKTAKPKNVGRANATTAEDQARIESYACYEEQLKTGYFERIEDVDNARTFFSPMLAYEYAKKFKFKAGEEYFSQPKLDGIRAIITRGRIQTRTGKDDIVSCPHILAELDAFFDEFPDTILDGELYNHALKHDFNKIVSLCKQKTPTAEQLEESRNLIQFHVYDCFAPGLRGFKDRYIFLTAAVPLLSDCVKLVDTRPVSSPEAIDAAYGEYLTDAYEGQMIRLNREYENKRSTALLKRKEFITEEFVVDEILEGEGNRAGMAGMVRLERGDGRTFKAGIKGSHEYARQLLVDKEKYVGGDCTIRFPMYTPDGIPRFGVAIQFYEGKRTI